MNSKRPFVILSAERADRGPAVNKDLSRQLQSQLSDILPTLPVFGSYSGRLEESFLCLLPETRIRTSSWPTTAGQTYVLHGHERAYEFDHVLSLARRYGQESILYVDAGRFAYLVPVPVIGRPVKFEPIGPWREVSRAAIRPGDCYTADCACTRFWRAGA
jgi:hypothetical protein